MIQNSDAKWTYHQPPTPPQCPTAGAAKHHRATLTPQPQNHLLIQTKARQSSSLHRKGAPSPCKSASLELSPAALDAAAPRRHIAVDPPPASGLSRGNHGDGGESDGRRKEVPAGWGSTTQSRLGLGRGPRFRILNGVSQMPTP
jgi:hypothetical protein